MNWPSQVTRSVRRVVLRAAAHRYADHHWPVVPGAPRRGDRFECGEPGCPTTGCHPAMSGWESAASADHDQVDAWWERIDHGVLLATGHSFDVLELASPLGRQVAREVDGPVALAPPRRWMFLVRRGAELSPQLAAHPAVVLHRAGSWIPAPPTSLGAGHVRWANRPLRCRWRLPDCGDVQKAVLRAMNQDRQARLVWRPLTQAGVASHLK